MTPKEKLWKNSSPLWSVTSKAHAVQGLVCAHGYKDSSIHTLPVRSVFVSIEALYTCVEFNFSSDTIRPPIIELNGEVVTHKWYQRMTQFVNGLLGLQNLKGSYSINISQNFQSGIGVGSSAAVYAALTNSIIHGLRKNLSPSKLSNLARYGSYSAAAAVTGHVSTIRTSNSPTKNVAEIICLAQDFPYQLIILPVAGEKFSEEIHKDIKSSPFYDSWLQEVRKLSNEVISSISEGKTDDIASKIEAYIYVNCAAISTGSMNLLTWRPGTLRRLILLRKIRETFNIPFFLSMNSGPSIFIYIRPENVNFLLLQLEKSRIRWVVSNIGGPVQKEDSTGF